MLGCGFALEEEGKESVNFRLVVATTQQRNRGWFTSIFVLLVSMRTVLLHLTLECAEL